MECMALLTSQLEKQKQYWEAKVTKDSSRWRLILNPGFILAGKCQTRNGRKK